MLTKSDFLLFLDSPIHLWAKKHNKVEREKTPFVQSIIDQGYEVEDVAKEFMIKHISRIFEYQKIFETNNTSCKTDFTVFNNQTGKIDIYEVKSGTDVKLDNEYDITFQYITASQLVKIGKVYIIHLNKEYTRDKRLDLKNLFVIHDMTETIEKRLLETEILIKQALLVINKPSPQGLEGCFKPKDCCCPQLCFPSLPKYSIYNLSNVHKERLIQLREKGILDINDIPDTFPLSHRQNIQAKSTKEKRTIINYDKIKDFLSEISYPLYFLDYESYNWAIPQFQNHTIYQNVVFQYSLHIQGTPNSNMEHKEFLSVTHNDPMYEIAKSISENIGDSGIVMVWYKQFEKGCNKEMGRVYPEFKEKLININSRIIDLSDIFSKQMYVDYRFNGSWSIKNVLPVLVPELGYKGLNINNGTLAMLEWKKLVYGNLDKNEKDEIYNNLLEYCGLDTFAMKKILDVINELF